MKYFKYLFITICFIFLPNIVKADCSYERLAELSRIAGNVNFSYTYDIDKKNRPNFNVNIVNVTKDIYVYDSSRNQTITSFETNLTNLTSGQTLQFDIYSNDNNCRGEKIMSKNITLPKYNSYINTETCDDYPKFKYCQLWLDTDYLSIETFDAEFEKYLAKKSETNNTSDSTNDFSFIEDNLLLIIFVIIGIVILPLAIILRRRI